MRQIFTKTFIGVIFLIATTSTSARTYNDIDHNDGVGKEGTGHIDKKRNGDKAADVKFSENISNAKYRDSNVRVKKPMPILFSISKNDEKNIKLKAQGAVNRFMDLLNIIATGLDLDVTETEAIMRRSYLPLESKIFLDSTVIVEDDIRKMEDTKLSKQKTAYSYLRDFEIFYKKSESATVKFSNFKLSNVKQGNYVYIKVHYDCLFNGQSKISNEPYSIQRRVAELRVEKLNNKWKTWVIDIHYEDSADIATTTQNDIPVVDDLTANVETPADTDTVNLIVANKTLSDDPLERDRIRRKNDSIRTYMAFRILIDSGKNALNVGNYIIAYQFFNEAETVVNGSNTIIRNNDKDFLETMIGETKRKIDISHRTPDQTYQIYLQEALLKKNQRKYEDAIDFYSKALNIKPDDEDIKSKIKSLTTSVNNLARLDAKYMAGNYKDAIKEYDKAIASDASNSDYYVGRGKCYDRIKENKKAIADYSKAIDLDQNNIEAYKAKALMHERLKAIPEAIAAYTVCTSIDRNDVSAYAKIADLNLQKNNLTAAMGILDKGISSNPQASQLHYRRGQLLRQEKQVRLAILAFNAAIMYDSINPRLYFERGLCNIEIKDISSAGFDFAAARRLGLEPQLNQQSLAFANEFYTSGLTQLKEGRMDVALSMFANARLIDPSFAGYHYQTGYVNFYMKNYEQAIENFTDAIGLDSRYAAAYQMRGLARYKKAQYSGSVQDLEKSIEIEPKIAETYKYLGDVLVKQKDYKKALSKYDESLDANKSRNRDLDDSLKADLYFGKGYACLYTADLKNALQYFTQSIKISKNVAHVYYYRGLTYLKQKEFSDAIENIEKALSFEPRQPIWNTTLGEIYYQKGKFDKALPLFEKAIGEESAPVDFSDPYYHRANTHFKMNDFQAALNDYQYLLQTGADKKYEDFNTSIGHTFLYLDLPDSAMVYFNKENKQGLNALSLYGTAIAYVFKSQPDLAFKYLEKSMTAGKVPKSMITNDKRLSGVKSDKRYKAFIKKYY
jgi:tetratricopeptide (TPR) repeat protein